MDSENNQFKVLYELNPEDCCYRDAIKELKKGCIAYVYKEPILKKIIEKLPNVKVTKKEFYWRVENVESKLY